MIALLGLVVVPRCSSEVMLTKYWGGLYLAAALGLMEDVSSFGTAADEGTSKVAMLLALKETQAVFANFCDYILVNMSILISFFFNTKLLFTLRHSDHLGFAEEKQILICTSFLY